MALESYADDIREGNVQDELTERMDELREERGSVYGDVRDNHEGIAQMWAPILKEQANRIAKGEPLPAWVVTLMMAILKINRMRLKYHQDNFDDLFNYARFTNDLQREDHDKGIAISSPLECM